MNNVTTGPHGLSIAVDVSSFPMIPYMSAASQVSPIGLFTSLCAAARISNWNNPRFILAETTKSENLGMFIICAEYKFSPSWYNSVSGCMVFHEDRVYLKEVVRWQLVVSYIGAKTLELKDTVYSKTGQELGSTRLVMGLVNLDQRKMMPVPDAIKAKAKLIANPADPLTVKVRNAVNPALSREDIVQISNTDIYKHTNFSFYLQVVSEALQMANQDMYAMEKFVILCMKETALNDVLTTVVWQTGQGHYFCKTTCGDKDVAFCHVTFKEHMSKM